MEQIKKSIGDWLFENIEENIYLKKLYNNLIIQYSCMLQGNTFYLSSKEIKDLHRFADLLSKSTENIKAAFHKNIAQNIVCILDKLDLNERINSVFMGSVLTNINNYVGLEGKCKGYKNTDLIESMVEVIVKEAYRLPKECGDNLFFDASQGVAFDNIKNQDYYSFSGPTSMGKTFLVKMFIKTQIVKGEKYNYVILVPSRALINEVRSEIIDVIGDFLYKEKYKVITAPTSVMNDYNYIMIYTQERLSYQIKLHEDIKIDYLFVDEAQKISEVGMRSAFFYKIINYMAKKSKNTKIFFLCPNIPNPEIYLKLIPNDNRKKFDVFEFSPVNQHKSILDLVSKRLLLYSDLTKEFISIQTGDRYTSTTNFIYHVGHNKSNIVFCDSKKSVEFNAIEYWKKCEEDNDPELKMLIEDIKKDIHPKSFLVYFLSRGICCHVGYLPSTIKVKIEELFRKRIIKTIFCTSTLLEGVNLPADNLFIVIKNSSYILKNSADFKNLMGRVGRKTYNLIGNVYVIPESGSSLETFERCKELIEKPVEKQNLSIDKILDVKLKDKIIACLLNGTGTLDKSTMTYEVFGMSRFIINILIKSIIDDDTNNYIYKQFNEFLDEKNIELIKCNFANQVVVDDSNVTSDQLRNLDKEIQNDKIKYPDIISYDNVKKFLEDLYDLFLWNKYERKTEIGKKGRLQYYAVLLNQWMQGHSVRRIIDESIKYHKKIGKIYSDKEKKMIDYTEQNSQDNSIIIECLTAIEDVLLFSISNYFTKFTERYKAIKNISVIENDWSEYLDFGTNNKLVIELQKVGFSREIAKIVEKYSYAFFNDDGRLRISKDIFYENNNELINELSDVKLNYAELFLLTSKEEV